MSTENDVPLGDGSRRYYEQQFGDRIRQVNKGGSAPRGKGSGGGGSGWNGRAGCGLTLAAFFILRLIVALVGSSSRTTTYDKPITPPAFDADLQKQLDDIRAGNQDQEQLNELLRQLRENKIPLEVDQPRPNLRAEFDPLLTVDDVPLLQGLCYRLQQESLLPGPAPGKHLLSLLDADVRPLLVKCARGQALTDEESGELIDGLNEVLEHANFWKPDAFKNVRAVEEFLRTHDPILAGGPAVRSLPDRRAVLECCYPKQIVPLKERAKWKGPSREAWLQQARVDLIKARMEYEHGQP